MKCHVCGGALSHRVKGVSGRGCLTCGHFEYFKEPVDEVPPLSKEDYDSAVADIAASGQDTPVMASLVSVDALTEDELKDCEDALDKVPEPAVLKKRGRRVAKKGSKK